MNISNLKTTDIVSSDYFIVKDKGFFYKLLASTVSAEIESDDAAAGRVVDSADGDYTLQPTSTLENYIYINDEGANTSLTIPNTTLIPVGTLFTVANTSDTYNMVITLASGVTCAEIDSGLSYVEPYDVDAGYKSIKFLKTDTTTFIAWGDIS